MLEITVRDHGRGIPDVEKVLLVKDQPDEFAETVIELYNDEKRLEDLAEKTQVYIREHFSIDAAWDVIKEDFLFICGGAFEGLEKIVKDRKLYIIKKTIRGMCF